MLALTLFLLFLGILDGPDVRKLYKDMDFYEKLTDMEKTAFECMGLVIEEFLGNKRAVDYEKNIDDMLLAFHNIGVHMNLKIHFLHSHLNFFKENLGAVSDEHGERFHQELKVVEARFKGKPSIPMLCEYFWTIYR